MSLSTQSPCKGCWSPNSSGALSNESILAEVDELRRKNEVLQQQIERSFNAKEEFEALHQQIRGLSSKLSDSEQRSETLSSRLKISQQRKQELENRINGFCAEIQNLKTNLAESNKKVSEMESTITDLEFRKSEAEKNDLELKKFFSDFSEVSGQKVTSFQQVISSFKSNLEENKNKLEENEKTHTDHEQELAAALKQLVKKNKKSKKNNAQLLNDNETLQEIIKKTKEQISALEEQAQELMNHNEALMQQNEASVKEIENAQSEIQEIIAKNEVETNKLQNEVIKYQDMVTQRDQRIKELNKIMNSPEQTGQIRIEELTQELTQTKCDLSSLSQQHSELNELEKKVENKLRQAKAKIDNQKAELSKYKKKLKSFSKQKQTESQSKMANELEKQMQQCAKYAEEIDRLRIQLQEAHALHIQDETANAEALNEKEKMQKSLHDFEKYINQQKMEITKLSADRSRLVSITQRLLQAISKYEFLAKQNEEKVRDLTKKANSIKQKKATYEAIPAQQCDDCLLTTLSQYLIPQLPQQARENLNAILSDPRVPPNQRINNICREVANNMKQPQQEQCTEESNTKSPTSQIESIIDGIIRGFSSILRNREMIDSSVATPITRDFDIINFITEKTAQLELVLNENELMSPQFVSLDFMFSGSIEERKRALQEIACKGWDARYTFEMFCLQCLVNIALDKELMTVRNIVESQTAELENIEGVFGTCDPEKMEETIKQVTDQMKKLKSKNKKLKKACVELQNYQPEPEVDDSLRNIIDDQQEKITQITNELEKYREMVSSLEGEEAKKAKIIEALEAEKSELKDENRKMQFDHRNEIAEFEKSVFTANQEVRETNMKMSKQAIEFESKIKEQKIISDNDHSKSVAKEDKLKRTINVLKDKQKKLEQTMQHREKENQQECRKLVDAQNQLKAKLANSIDAIKSQTSENQQLSQKLADALKANEAKAQNMMKEITKLQTSKKTAEVQIQSLRDQMKREAELIESQYKFKSVAEETRHQEEIASLKAKIDKEKNSLIMAVLEEFNALQNYGEEDVDSSSFMSIIHKIGLEYRRTKQQTNC